MCLCVFMFYHWHNLPCGEKNHKMIPLKMFKKLQNSSPLGSTEKQLLRSMWWWGLKVIFSGRNGKHFWGSLLDLFVVVSLALLCLKVLGAWSIWVRLLLFFKSAYICPELLNNQLLQLLCSGQNSSLLPIALKFLYAVGLNWTSQKMWLWLFSF